MSSLTTQARSSLVVRANSLGPVSEHKILWNSEKWKEGLRKDSVNQFLPPLESVIDHVDSSNGPRLTISRDQVEKCFAVGPLVGYLAAIIWGCGETVNRVRMLRVLRENDNVSQRIHDLVTACASATPSSAWDILHTAPHKLHRLGMAFGSKVAYFAALAARGPETPSLPLIADRYVAVAWAQPITRRKESYVAYCQAAAEIAPQLDIGKRRPDQVEYALFGMGKAGRKVTDS